MLINLDEDCQRLIQNICPDSCSPILSYHGDFSPRRILEAFLCIKKKREESDIILMANICSQWADVERIVNFTIVNFLIVQHGLSGWSHKSSLTFA